MVRNFEYMTNLQYEVKSLKAQVAFFQSGEKYRSMKADSDRQLLAKDREIQTLKRELEASRRETANVRKNWMQVFDDLEKEHAKALLKKEQEIGKLEKSNLKYISQRDNAKDKYREKNLELYEVKSKLEEEIEKNKKLTAQVNKDFENSSLPSSMQVGRKKIPNSREKTGNSLGGQPGHRGHGRKWHSPTQTQEIPAPEKYSDSPDFKETGKTIRKQKIVLHVSLEVIEYYTKEFRNVKTGQRVHAQFPEGLNNDVNYDGTVKAFAFLLGNECNVSHDKVKRFLSELTGGELELSKGMINGLCREFSQRTVTERKKAYDTLLSSPVMNIDFTNANVNGKSAQVLICATPGIQNALFIAREHKGHKGIKDTPVEIYQGSLVHDHDTTFYSYGQRHQECMQHNCRYLKGSEENEPGLTWNSEMHTLVKEMLHYRNSIGEERDLDSQIVDELEKRYDGILETAEKEYEYEPPSDYYREGYNLYRRLKKYKDSELLFLHDKRVPANNSLCERLARVYKRKQKQAMVLRSYENFSYLCDSMSVVYLLRGKKDNLYNEVTSIFGRPRSIAVES